VFVKTELPQQLGLHLHAVSTHLDKLVHEPPSKKILDPPMPWQQAIIEIMLAISLTIACSRYIYNGVILHAHPLRGESHNQRNTTGEVATTSPPFYNEPHRSHVLCVNAELGTTSTSWSQHRFVACPSLCNTQARTVNLIHAILCIFFNFTSLFLYVLIMKPPNFSNFITIFHLYTFILKVANNPVLLLKTRFEILQCNSPNKFIL